MSYIYLLDDPDTIAQEFVSAANTGGGVCAIPSCGEYVTDTEQWCRLDCIVTGGSSTQSSIVAVDTRPNKYEFCESFAELEAGTYKLMVEVLGNHILRQGGIGFVSYGGNIYDSYTPTSAYTPSNVYERFALVAEDDTLIIPETNIFDSTTVRNSETAPYPNFFHKEYTFTLTKKTKVGVIHRAYSNAHNYWSGDADLYAYFRFMICNADVEAEEFESTNLYANISGESAWEPYRCYLPLIIRSGENEQTVDIDLGASLLEAGETVSYSDTHTAIPTYIGVNTITADSDIQPAEMYVKYVR